MRKKAVWLFFGLCMMAVVAMAQDVPSGLTSAFKQGSAQELSAYLATHVEMISSDGAQTLAKADAVSSLSRFFADHSPKGFVVNHQGKRGESGFLVGTLTTAGESFRLNIFFKKRNGTYLIHQIRIDKTHE